MTKNEFLSKLSEELQRNKIGDTADIVNEYEQHFAFKLSDGYSEEEICAKLGDPAVLAAQFKREGENNNSNSGKKILTITGVFFIDLFAGMIFILLAAWEIVMAALFVSSFVFTVCLFSGINIHTLIPPMPYWCGVVFGLAFAAFSILIAIGSFYYTAFFRQSIRSFGRYHHNILASFWGKALAPSIGIRPSISANTARKLRMITRISLAAFIIFSILACIISALTAEAMGFWHVWGWFGYTG